MPSFVGCLCWESYGCSSNLCASVLRIDRSLGLRSVFTVTVSPSAWLSATVASRISEVYCWSYLRPAGPVRAIWLSLSDDAVLPLQYRQKQQKQATMEIIEKIIIVMAIAMDELDSSAFFLRPLLSSDLATFFALISSKDNSCSLISTVYWEVSMESSDSSGS